jgi:hypothetical protein
MTIERKELEFLLSHFEPPALPRRISTYQSHDKQFAAFTIEYMLAEFQRSKGVDCKVNAYRYLGEKEYSCNNIAGGIGGNGNGHGGNNKKSSSKSDDPNNFFYNYEYNEQLTRYDVAQQIKQKAMSEAAPTFLNLDIDGKDFSSDRTHKNAVKRTINRIHELFLISKDKSPVTLLWTGGGNQILIPLEIDPTKYPVTNNMTMNQTVPGRDLRYANLFTGGRYYRFNAYHKLPANLFLRFAEEYITQGKYDGGHKPSVRSAMIRVPGSYNSKYLGEHEVDSGNDLAKAEVKIEQRWDGHTKVHIIFLLGAFYRSIEDTYKKHARMRARASKIKQKVQAAQITLERRLITAPEPERVVIAGQTNDKGRRASSTYAHNKYWYVDKLLRTPVDDYRKRGIDLVLAPFLITIMGRPPDAAERITLNWLDRCSILRPLDFDATERVRSKIIYVKATHFLPLGEEKFKTQYSSLFYRLSRRRGSAVGS